MPYDRMQDLARTIDLRRAEGFTARCAARGEACQCPDAPRVTSHECPVHQHILMVTAVMVPEGDDLVLIGAGGVFGRIVPGGSG